MNHKRFRYLILNRQLFETILNAVFDDASQSQVEVIIYHIEITWRRLSPAVRAKTDSSGQHEGRPASQRPSEVCRLPGLRPIPHTTTA